MNALTPSNARRCAVGATLVAAALTVMPPGAQSQSKPEVGCFGYLFKDKVGDVISAGPAADDAAKPENLDLVEGWFTDDGSKATVHLKVKNLTKDIPQGATAIQWQVEYGGSTTGEAAWVRTAVDFTGVVVHEYGGVEDTPAIPFNVRQGATEGGFVEGPDGIVSMTLPDQEPKGTSLKAFIAHTYEAVQALPSAAPTPIKGGSLYEDDNAAGGKYVHKIGDPCPAAPAAPAVTPGAPAAPGTPSATNGSAALPVKVATKSVSRKKAKKRISLKLTSTEPLTKVAAQLVKGKKVFGKGALKSLKGKGTMKLKVTKKLKKGTYRLDLVGTDSSGARRFAVARFKVK